MASSCAGGEQTPPPPNPPPPSDPPHPVMSKKNMSQLSGHIRTGGKVQEGKTKSSKRGKQSGEQSVADELKRFDMYYGKKGNVYLFPEVKEPKVKAYQKHKERHAKPQGTPGASGGPTTMQDEKQSKSTLGQVEVKSDQTNATTNATSTQSPTSEQIKESTKKNRYKMKEPDSYILDEKKLEESKKTGQVQGEEGELVVIKRTKAALEEITRPEDPPAFLLHNQQLGKKRDKEIDVLVMHPSLGVLILEVKATTSTTDFTDFNKATTQLLGAQELIQEEMGDLLEKDAFVLTIVLPNLKQNDADLIRQEVEKRKTKKQSPDVTERQTSNVDEPVLKSSTGTAVQGAIPSSAADARPDGKASSASSTAPQASASTADVTSPTSHKPGKKSKDGKRPGSEEGSKKDKHLEDHPEIRILCGSRAGFFKEWMRKLQRHRDRTGHAFKGATAQERLESFKLACARRFSVSGLSPGQSVKESADLHRRFLLTEEQLLVRDSQAELMHISGPCGSGKTLLLAERARRWLREGRRVAVAVGNTWHNVLLQQLTRSVVGEKADVTKFSTFEAFDSLLEWLDTISADDTPVSIIVDEAIFLLYETSYPRLLDHVAAGHVKGLWTADTITLPYEDERKLLSLGGSTVDLSKCFRCPPHILAWIDNVRADCDLPLLPPPVPITRELGVEVEIISHPDHCQNEPWNTCRTCKEKVSGFFSSLGVLGDQAKSALKLSDVVVLTTEMICDRDRVAQWLRDLGLHTVAVKGSDFRPAQQPGVTPEPPGQTEEEARRQAILKGTDVKGNAAAHVMYYDHFQGLEKPVVLLWHEDWDDDDPDKQTEEDKRRRMLLHRHYWFRAATRCQGCLAVVIATRTPVLSLLPVNISPKPPEWEVIYRRRPDRTVDTAGLQFQDLTITLPPEISFEQIPVVHFEMMPDSALPLVSPHGQVSRRSFANKEDILSSSPLEEETPSQHWQTIVKPAQDTADFTFPPEPPEWEVIYQRRPDLTLDKADLPSEDTLKWLLCIIASVVVLSSICQVEANAV